MKPDDPVAPTELNQSQSASEATPWQHWARRIIAIVTLISLAVCIVVVMEWERERPFRSIEITETKTAHGRLKVRSEPGIPGDLESILKQLPSLEQMNGNGLRMIFMPFNGFAHYAITLTPFAAGKNANAQLFVFERSSIPPQNKSTEEVRVLRYDLKIPLSELQVFLKDFDARVDQYRGESDGRDYVDGSPIAFERIRGSQIVSGSGNDQKHYRTLSNQALRLMMRFGPTGVMPTEGDWRRYVPLPANVAGQ
jgi:hypothetical protein